MNDAPQNPSDDEPQTPLITRPLSVEVVDGEVVLDGELPVVAVLTPEAAIETGVDLINAGMKLGTGRSGLAGD